ncbi:hypothetical protein AB835_09230 [Candidatus Endobugula sertula]|uniref:phosphoribosylaminoimidazolesuccinocarboxamide synthase n=1 Tax=Candidatus Endobugula sertula TaxID=62101 RepID=A0A1D2QPA1_9GAMM|nr:hypothetical protein AB835_09230 [Candidatus Endobugula sertula]
MPKSYSTRKLTIIQPSSEHSTGVGVFNFEDDYSVYHYGKMPDKITGKGESICRMAAENFKILEKEGIKTHFRQFIPPNKIEFDLFRIINPHIKKIAHNQNNYFIPLQVIFRNSLPKGSSIFRRLKEGTITLEQFNLNEIPVYGQVLNKPIIEFTTKLEEIDRYISDEEAQNISSLTDDEMKLLKNTTLKINKIISDKAISVGLEIADGKIEFALSSSRELVLVDVVGTLDDNRILYHGVQLSKQLLRNYYDR